MIRTLSSPEQQQQSRQSLWLAVACEAEVFVWPELSSNQLRRETSNRETSRSRQAWTRRKLRKLNSKMVQALTFHSWWLLSCHLEDLPHPWSVLSRWLFCQSCTSPADPRYLSWSTDQPRQLVHQEQPPWSHQQKHRQCSASSAYHQTGSYSTRVACAGCRGQWSSSHSPPSSHTRSSCADPSAGSRTRGARTRSVYE